MYMNFNHIYMGTDAVIFVIEFIQTPNSFDFIMNRNPIHLMIYDINCKETEDVNQTPKLVYHLFINILRIQIVFLH